MSIWFFPFVSSTTSQLLTIAPCLLPIVMEGGRGRGKPKRKNSMSDPIRNLTIEPLTEVVGDNSTDKYRAFKLEEEDSNYYTLQLSVSVNSVFTFLFFNWFLTFQSYCYYVWEYKNIKLKTISDIVMAHKNKWSCESISILRKPWKEGKKSSRKPTRIHDKIIKLS